MNARDAASKLGQPLFDLDPIYRMPATLGPAPGPRNMPKSKQHLRFAGDVTSVSIKALTDETRLAAILPPRCRLSGDPILTVGFSVLTNLGWLAGRGYNILRATCEIVHEGEEREVRGNFSIVLWESHADPILTGREELGTPKLYAHLPNPRFIGDGCTIEADWEGFRFCRMEVEGLEPTAISAAPAHYAAQGGLPLLCYRYHLNVGDWQRPEVATMTMSTPGEAPPPTVKEQYAGTGRFEFFAARWEDMPTQYPFVTTLAALPLLEFRGASMTKVSGIADLAAMVTIR